MKEYYNLRNDHERDTKRVKLVSKYAHDVLELTADHPGYDTNEKYEKFPAERENYIYSLKEHYIETKNDTSDQKNLCHSVQEHYCNNFCMRNSSPNSRYVCYEYDFYVHYIPIHIFIHLFLTYFVYHKIAKPINVTGEIETTNIWPRLLF